MLDPPSQHFRRGQLPSPSIYLLLWSGTLDNLAHVIGSLWKHSAILTPVKIKFTAPGRPLM